MSITIQGINYNTKNGTITISVEEHCTQEYHEDMFVDGISALRNPDLKQYIQYSTNQLQKKDIDMLTKTVIVVPPQTRASALVRETASKMIRSIQADKILEENVAFQHVDLYYRPMYVYKYHWKSKNKDAVVEVDGLTGQITFSQENFQQLVGNVFDYYFLFDIGKDAAGMFIPGSGIAIKIAKKYIDVTKQRK